MKNIFMWIVKAVASGLVATALVCCFDLIYYNTPVHHESESGATDYVWDKSTIVARLVEGTSFLRTDSNGYNNAESLVEADKDILLMGSSQMEAFEVMADQSVGALLNDYYDSLNTYNIGISAHFFVVCVKNLEAALSEYTPSSYVCIETQTLTFTASEIESYLGEDAPHLTSTDTGLLYYLQRIPYVRNMYHQIDDGLFAASETTTGEVDDEVIEEAAVDLDTSLDAATAAAYDKLFSHIADTCAEQGVTPIIFYHPTVSLDEDGSLSCNVDEEGLALFAVYCEEYGIVFVDVSDYFLQMYEEDHVVPYGFLNTKLCSGHLNKYGHQAIARALEDCIDGLESGEN